MLPPLEFEQTTAKYLCGRVIGHQYHHPKLVHCLVYITYPHIPIHGGAGHIPDIGNE